jgi:hypothetical protein
MRGEDLQGLSLEELKKIEKLIEGSLRRVVEEKVCAVFSCLDSVDRLILHVYAENFVQYLTNIYALTSICFRRKKVQRISMLSRPRSHSLLRTFSGYLCKKS